LLKDLVTPQNANAFVGKLGDVPSKDNERNCMMFTSVYVTCMPTMTNAIPVIIAPWIIAAIMNLSTHFNPTVFI